MTICSCCQLDHSQLYCPSCLREGIATHQHLSRGLQRQVDESVGRARALCERVVEWRKLRADVWSRELRVARLRDVIRERERAIASTFRGPARTAPSLTRPRTPIQHEQEHISQRIVQARKVLVREAMGVFGVKLEGGWTIAGIPLPPPQALRDQSQSFTNAALVHVLHLVSLLTRYLSISLPFIPFFPNMPHVGRPLIRPNLPFVNTTRFRDKHVLWMSSTAKRVDSKGVAKYRQFLTSFALLAHSIAYLAWTQGVEGIGIRGDSSEEAIDSTMIIPATSILQLLAALADSPTLGVRSHEPPGTLRHLGFSLDVARVVDAVLANEGGDSSDWDMVDA